MPAAYFNVLMPTPGTALYAKLKAEDRILNEEEMGRWSGHLCHVRPLWCTPEELEQNVQQMYRQFYSIRSMVNRLPLPTSQATIANWVVNVSERRMARSAGNNDFDTY